MGNYQSQPSRISERSADPAPIELSSRLIGAGLGISTLVEMPLQITYFLCKTNPILSAVGGLQMNLNFYSTKDYENKHNWTLGQNKPNSNPISSKAKMNVKSLAKKSGHALLWIYLNLFLTLPKQTVKVPPSDLNLLYYHLRKEFTWRL
jgi:hypothetical protein